MNETSTEPLADQPVFPFSSNAIRLSLGEWIFMTLIILCLYSLAPDLWGWYRPLQTGADYRVPYALSEDYWIYNRYSREMVHQSKMLVIGDSVIWGEYVTPDQALSHHLNTQEGSERYANLGVNGIHPLALEGLLRYYGGPIMMQKVILQCNPLWMSSPRHDLQVDKELSFNHPRLVPQFFPWIPCYRAGLAERLSIAVERVLPLFGLARHFRVACFDSIDMPSWSLDHPYANPLPRLTITLPVPERTLRHKPISWMESGIPLQDFPWVALDSSLQWGAFQRTVEMLIKRGNQVFILAGPFNEHMLKDSSKHKYQLLKQEMESRFKEWKTAYCISEPLPSELYADASHPLNRGYEQLAEQMYHDPKFQEWKRQ